MDKRLCSECGKYITRGYVIENGLEYYCSEECLDKHYTEEEYLKMYDDGDGDSYYTEWEDEIEKEFNFVYNRLLQDDFFGFKKCFDDFKFDDKVKYEDVLYDTIEYCLYDGFFNPYYDKKYLDVAYLVNEETGLIYNIDDMYDVFYNHLVGIMNDLESGL